MLRPHVQGHAPRRRRARGDLLRGGDGSYVFLEDLLHALLLLPTNTSTQPKPRKLPPLVAARKGSRRLLIAVPVFVAMHRVILAQRKAIPIQGVQDAHQVGVIAES